MDTLERYKLTEAAREDYLLSCEGERFAESMRYVQTYPTDLPLLRDLLATIQTPVRIIAGRRDPVVPLVNAEFLHERLPLSQLAIIERGMAVLASLKNGGSFGSFAIRPAVSQEGMSLVGDV